MIYYTLGDVVRNVEFLLVKLIYVLILEHYGIVHALLDTLTFGFS